MKNLFTLLFLINAIPTFAQIPSGAALWLKADAGVTQVGGKVTAWADQSGNNYNVSQATVANQPILQTNVFNGQPAIYFDGGSNFLNNTTQNPVTAGAARTIFVVLKTTCASDGNTAIAFRRTAPCHVLQTNPSTNFIYTDGINAPNNSTVLATLFDTLKVKPTVLTYFSGGTGTKIQYRQNGVAQVVSQTGNVSTESGATGFTIGRREDNSFGNYGQTDGWIAEIIVYNSQLNATDITTVENYLSTKYGTALPPTPSSLASGKTTSATVTYLGAGNATYGAQNGVDGDVCTPWNAGTNAINSWQVDLGTPTTINDVIMVVRKDAGASWAAGSKIEVSTNNTTWSTVQTLSGSSPESYGNVIIKPSIPIPNIRYVRYTGVHSSSWVAISEMLVNQNLKTAGVNGLTPIVLNADGSVNDGTFFVGETYYASKAASYQWKRNNINIVGATNQDYTVTQPGNYTVTVTYSCGAACNTTLISANSFTGLAPNAIPTCGLQTNGTATGVTIADNNAIEPTTAFTYEAWFKTNAANTTTRVIADKSSAINMQLNVTTGYLSISSTIGGSVRTTQNNIALNDNLWHHASAVYDGSTLKLYVDGNVENSITATGAVSTNTADFKIGTTSTNTNPFNGTIDEVRFWNVAKTQTEIQDKLDEVLVGNEPGLQAYYNFNDNLFNGQNRLVLNKCSTTGAALNGTSFGTSAMPVFTCAAAAFTEPDCSMNVVNAGDNVTVPHNAALALTQFTLTAYIKTNQATATTKRIVYKEGASGGQNYSLNVTESGRAEIQFNNTNFAVSTTSVNDNVWHYIVGTYDGATLKIYVDGTQSGALATANTPSTSVSNNLFIGQNGAGNEQYIGRLDQISIWNRALTIAEIQSNIGYNLAGTESGLQAYYNFNDNRFNGTAQTVINKCTTTGAALNGTTSGTATTPNFSCVEVQPNRPACSMMLNGKAEGASNSIHTKLNTANNFTIEVICKPTFSMNVGQNNVTSAGYLIDKRYAIAAGSQIYSSSNTSGLNVCIATNGIQVWEQNGYYNHNGKVGLLGTFNDWVHVAVSCNAGTLKLYVNGVPVSSAPATGANYSIYALVGSYFAGNISETRFWDRTLTGAEIQANINTVYTGAEVDLRSLYRFNSTTQNGSNRVINGIGSIGSTNPLVTNGYNGNTQSPLFTCANYTPNTTAEAVAKPGSGNMNHNSYYGRANFNSWGNIPSNGTIGMWFKPSVVNATYPAQNIFTTAPLTADNGGNKGMRLELNAAGQLDVIFGDDNSTNNASTNRFAVNGSTTIEAGKWYNVAISFNKTNNTFSSYLNGIATNTNIANNKWATTYLDINTGIGYSDNNVLFTGDIDELIHFNIELTETQIKERLVKKLTNANALWTNVLNYYRFDQTSSGNLGGGTSVVYDYKGTNHGMIYGVNEMQISSAPLGDVSSYQYSGNTSTTNVNFGIGGADVATATLTTGTADGIHVYGVNELPNSQVGVNLPIASNNRYAGVFVVNPDATARYTLRYDYTNNTNVNASNEAQLKLFKRDNNSVSTWGQANNLSLDQTNNYLECTGQFTEYILGVNNSTLPLTLLSFDAKKLYNKEVLLQWKTENEINVDRFIVERSTDGQNFIGIGNVTAKNTPGSHYYSIVDNNLPNATTLYYRLRKIDVDGKFDYSKIEKLSLDKISKVIAYPNPAIDFVYLQSNIIIKKIEVLNINGQLISYLLPNLENKYDIKKLAKGTYYLKIYTTENIQNIKVLKL
jgi:hypothetical protein